MIILSALYPKIHRAYTGVCPVQCLGKIIILYLKLEDQDSKTINK